MREAHEFFVKHGGKAVVLARFVPIVRTFLPFVAGGADMPYRDVHRLQRRRRHRLGGHLRRRRLLFGNIPVVKENFELVVLGIVGVSVLPIAVRVLKMRAPPAGGLNAARRREPRLSPRRRPAAGRSRSTARASARIVSGDRIGVGRRHHRRVHDQQRHRRDGS